MTTVQGGATDVIEDRNNSGKGVANVTVFSVEEGERALYTHEHCSSFV